MRTQTLDAVHLQFNAEAGALLPLALRYTLLSAIESHHNIYIHVY